MVGGGECLILNSFPHAIQRRGLGLAIKCMAVRRPFTLCMPVLCSQGQNMAQNSIVLVILVFFSGKCFLYRLIFKV